MRSPRTNTIRAGAAVAALALLLTACGDDGDTGDDGDDTAADDTEEATGELELVSEGELTVCSDVPYPPFEFEDGDAPSGYSGFDIDLVQEIADRLDLDLVVNEAGFDGLASGATLTAGQCDLAASAMTINEERAQNLNFSDPYYDAEQSLIVLADSDIAGLDDLEGESLGVQGQTTGAEYAEENAPDGVQIVEFDQGPDVYTAMLAGQVAAGLQDLPVNLERAEEDERFEVVETFDTDEQYGFAAAVDNDALIDAVNEQLEAMRDDGTYDEIYEGYFAIE
jgi:polar amino acid transport system substrate-binding protein